MKAIVRRPSPRLAEGFVTYIERRRVDVELARAQWVAYVAALESAGWEIVEAPATPDCPDGVFIEDALVVFGDVAVVARPGVESRRAETVGVEEVAVSLGLRIARIEEPGTLDGGDVLKVRNEIHVGVGGRTNTEGVNQLRTVVESLGLSVKEVPLRGALHLKSTMTALPDGTLIDGNAVDLGAGRVLVARGAAVGAKEVAERGFEPIEVDISEFQKLEGDVTCLSVRVRP